MSIFGGARKGGGHALQIVYMSLQVALANLTVKLSAKTGHPKTVKHRVQHTCDTTKQYIRSMNIERNTLNTWKKTKATVSLEGLHPLFRSLPGSAQKNIVIPAIPLKGDPGPKDTKSLDTK